MNGKSIKPPTEQQLFSQAEMAMVAKFLRLIKPLIEIGYGMEAKREKRKPYNMAFSYHKKYGLKGEGADRQIDYAKVRLSEGRFPGLPQAAAERSSDQLTLSWSSDCFGAAWGSDQVMVLVYCPPVENENNAFALCEIGLARRTEGAKTLQLPLHLVGRPTEIYVFVQAADGKAVSDTQYLGRI